MSVIREEGNAYLIFRGISNLLRNGMRRVVSVCYIPLQTGKLGSKRRQIKCYLTLDHSLRKVNFSENFVYVLSEWSLTCDSKLKSGLHVSLGAMMPATLGRKPLT